MAAAVGFSAADEQMGGSGAIGDAIVLAPPLISTAAETLEMTARFIDAHQEALAGI